MNHSMIRTLVALATAALVACGGRSSDAPSAPGNGGATPRAACGPGSRPETGMQGRVSAEDHASGRAAQGFTCNTELVGTYTVPNAVGMVGGFKVERYVDKAGRECAYYDTTPLFPANVADANAGIHVLDMSDPAHPRLSARLVTPAMLSPHESLVVSQQAGVLAAVMAIRRSIPASSMSTTCPGTAVRRSCAPPHRSACSATRAESPRTARPSTPRPPARRP